MLFYLLYLLPAILGGAERLGQQYQNRSKRIVGDKSSGETDNRKVADSDQTTHRAKEEYEKHRT